MKREKPASKFATTTYAALCLCAVMIPGVAHAVKGHCEGDAHWQCTTYATSKENGAWYDAKTGQWYNKSCGCAANSSGGSNWGVGSYGHAEIHKKNVPTVKPSGGIGPMSVGRRPAWIMRRAPMRGAPPPAAFHRGPAFGPIR